MVTFPLVIKAVFPNTSHCQTLWHTLLNPVLRRQKKADLHEFKASHGYIVRL